jgi:hypothetical protein
MTARVTTPRHAHEASGQQARFTVVVDGDLDDTGTVSLTVLTS